MLLRWSPGAAGKEHHVRQAGAVQGHDARVRVGRAGEPGQDVSWRCLDEEGDAELAEQGGDVAPSHRGGDAAGEVVQDGAGVVEQPARGVADVRNGEAAPRYRREVVRHGLGDAGEQRTV
nr:hypothetical protein [Nonomuraea jiangxiensis]